MYQREMFFFIVKDGERHELYAKLYGRYSDPWCFNFKELTIFCDEFEIDEKKSKDYQKFFKVRKIDCAFELISLVPETIIEKKQL